MFKNQHGLSLGIILMLVIAVAGCSPAALPEEAGPVEKLPEPEEKSAGEAQSPETTMLPGAVLRDGSVAEALYLRISQRRFSEAALDLQQIGSLLWAAGGLNVDGLTGATRTHPSAGAAYPLDFYLAVGQVEGLEAGIYFYDYLNHTLVQAVSGDRRQNLAAAALNQGFIAEAPASIVLVAHFERTTGRYGERGERYVHMDAGYASQNIYLMATELGLATVAVGAYDDGKVAEILTTAGEPLLIMPVGMPLP